MAATFAAREKQSAQLQPTHSLVVTAFTIGASQQIGHNGLRLSAKKNVCVDRSYPLWGIFDNHTTPLTVCVMGVALTDVHWPKVAMQIVIERTFNIV